MYKTKEEAYRELNYELIVIRAEKLEEQRNALIELLFDTTKDTSKEPSKEPTNEQTTKQEHEFQIGDRVIVSKGTPNERTGTIVRLPMRGVDGALYYIVDLDDDSLGWYASVSVDGVYCKNAWYSSKDKMTLLED